MRFGVSTRRRRSKARLFVSVIVVVAAVVFCAVRLHTAFMSTAHAYANNIATTAISNSAYKVFSKVNNEYSSVTNHENAMLFATDTSKLNLINSELASLIQNEVLEGDNQTVYIPLGSVTGIAAISGFGPKLPVKMHPISLVNTDFKEQFDSCGINQVRYSVSLDVEIIMAYSGYLFSDKETVKVSVPVMSTVIVGNTPEYYGTGSIAAEAELKTE